MGLFLLIVIFEFPDNQYYLCSVFRYNLGPRKGKSSRVHY